MNVQPHNKDEQKKDEQQKQQEVTRSLLNVRKGETLAQEESSWMRKGKLPSSIS